MNDEHNSMVGSRGELWLKIALATVSVVLLVMAFSLYGNTINIKLYGTSLFGWLAGRWVNAGIGQAAKWFIPLISLIFAAVRFPHMLRAPKAVDWRGLALIIFAMTLHWAAAKAQQTRLSVVAVILLLWAIPLFLCGRRVAADLLFPCGFLLFIVPLNFLDRIAYLLIRFSVSYGLVLLKGFGLDIARTSPVAFVTKDDGLAYQFWRGAPELELLVLVMAIAVLLAYLMQSSRGKQITAAFLGFAAYVFAQVIRIVTTALLGGSLGARGAQVLQRSSGHWLVLVAAIIFMLIFSALLHVQWKKRMESWKEYLLSPTS